MVASGWQARVLTLFPGMFPGPLGHSLAGKALEGGLWSLDVIDIRDYGHGKHKSVDDAPFGGGAGMVMRADVVSEAIEAGLAGLDSDVAKIYFTPRGRPMEQSWVREVAASSGALMVCGRYEGLDQRVIEDANLIEVSLGDFVLSGGEMAALSLMDGVVRLLPGVMGNSSSPEQESFENGLLEHPHYTQPRVWKGYEVPEVLTSGDHGRISSWRLGESESETRERRPDLWARYVKEKG